MLAVFTMYDFVRLCDVCFARVSNVCLSLANKTIDKQSKFYIERKRVPRRGIERNLSLIKRLGASESKAE